MTALLDSPVHTRTIAYRDLTPQQRNGWHSLERLTHDLEQAAKAGANIAAELTLAHATAALFLDVELPAGDTLVECSCETCPDACDRIVPFSECAEYLDGSIQRPQCPTCVADHRHYGD